MAAAAEEAEDKAMGEGAGNPGLKDNARLMICVASFRDRHREWYCRKEYHGEKEYA
jgi:hypothetical protein